MQTGLFISLQLIPNFLFFQQNWPIFNTMVTFWISYQETNYLEIY